MMEKNENTEFKKPDFFKGKTVYFKKSALTTAAIITLIEIIIISVAFAVFYPDNKEEPFIPVKEAMGWDTLRIDGDRDSNFVLFNHMVHIDTLGKSRKECRTCHHLSLPNDGPSSCVGCHRLMDMSTLLFDHAKHQQYYSIKNGCIECHSNNNKSKENAKTCTECHPEYTKDVIKQTVRSYQAAMHANCVVCHAKRDKTAGIKKHSLCKNCHPNQDYTDFYTQFYLK